MEEVLPEHCQGGNCLHWALETSSGTFLFHPYHLVAASSKLKLPFSHPCSFFCLFPCTLTLHFQFWSDEGRFYLKLFLTGHKAKLGKVPRQIKILVILLWNEHKGQIFNCLNLNSVDHEPAESHVSLRKLDWFLITTICIITVIVKFLEVRHGNTLCHCIK